MEEGEEWAERGGARTVSVWVLDEVGMKMGDGGEKGGVRGGAFWWGRRVSVGSSRSCRRPEGSRLARRSAAS